MPALGLRLTFQTAAVIGALGGAACLAAALRPQRIDELRTQNSNELERRTTNVERRTSNVAIPAAVAIAAVAAILSLPGWDRELLASGAYKYAPYLGTENFETVLRAGTLEYYKEGAAATVSVRRLTGTTSLAIDGKVDASNAGDMLTQRMLGLLPVLLHGQAREICIIGLGSGVTARLRPRLRPRRARRRRRDLAGGRRGVAFLRPRERRRARPSPASGSIVGDGRSHLLLTPRRYDVIVSEPSNPWMAGVASLFTASSSRRRARG